MDTNQTNTPTGNITGSPQYAARLQVDYPEKLDRLTTLFRIFTVIPIAIIYGIIAGAGETVNNTIVYNQAGQIIRHGRESTGGILAAIFLATLLMILFQQRYPRWWFDFARELTRFGYRIAAYMALLTDQYPSTVDEQAVHLEIDYPNVEADLQRGMPLIKWFLAIPHYIVLAFLFVGAVFAVIFAWFAILFTGQYPKGLFDYVVGVGRYGLRVDAYAALLVTDQYPPFSLD
jgi:mannose/fructose/N-acetylgalactosamine-specific phosphotransferase system component IIC